MYKENNNNILIFLNSKALYFFTMINVPGTYILLTECEGRTGRISARGLGSMDWATSARSVQERPRADILPVRPEQTSVSKRFITRLLVSEKTRTAKATSIQRAKIAKIKLIVLVGFLVQL